MDKFDPFNPDEAADRLREAIAGGDVGEITRVAGTYIWTLLTHHYELLVEATMLLPKDVLDRYSELLFLQPMVLSPSETGYRDVGLTDVSGPKDEPDDLVDERLVRTMLSKRLSGEIAAAAEIADRLDERMTSAGRDPVRVTPSLSQFRLQIGVSHLLNRQTERAVASFKTARQLAALNGHDHVQRDASAKLAVAHALRGSIEQAERDLQESRLLPYEPAFFSRFIETSERIADALINIERLVPLEEQQAFATEQFEAGDEFWPFIALAKGRLEISRAQPAEALDFVELMFESHPYEPGTFADDIRTSLTADAFLMLGEVGSAREISSNILPRMLFSQTSRIRVLVRSGELTTAAQMARTLSGSRNLPPSIRYEVTMLLAQIDYDLDRSIDVVIARSIAQIAFGGQHRRLFTMLEYPMIEAICDRLGEHERQRFMDAVCGIPAADPAPPRAQLTTSEIRVLSKLATGSPTAQIAAMLHVSPNTVKKQLASINRKLGVRNRADALASALQMGLLNQSLED